MYPEPTGRTARSADYSGSGLDFGRHEFRPNAPITRAETVTILNHCARRLETQFYDQYSENSVLCRTCEHTLGILGFARRTADHKKFDKSGGSERMVIIGQETTRLTRRAGITLAASCLCQWTSSLTMTSSSRLAPRKRPQRLLHHRLDRTVDALLASTDKKKRYPGQHDPTIKKAACGV